MEGALSARPQEKKVRRSQQERSADARAKLLDAAVRLICEKGFASATMADIAAAAGLTRGAIQHHFAGRGELILAILQSVEVEILESFASTAADSADTDLGERVDRLIDKLGMIGRSDSYQAVIDIWMSTRADPSLRDAVHQSVLRSISSYRDLWQRTFDKDVPAAIISDCRRVVVSVMRGLVVSRVFFSDPPSVALTLATCKKMVRHHMMTNR